MYADSLKKYKSSLGNFPVDSSSKVTDDLVHDDLPTAELLRTSATEATTKVASQSRNICSGDRRSLAKDGRPKKSKNPLVIHRRELRLLKQMEFGSGGSSSTSRAEKRLQAEYLVPIMDIKKPKISNGPTAVEGSKTVVIPQGYPKVNLTYQQAEEVVSLIVDRIETLEPEAGIFPGFEDHYFTSGACVLICKDDSSRLWVNNIVKSFCLENVSLQTAGIEVLTKGIKAGAYFSGKTLSPEKLLTRLKVQNPIVDFSSWSVLCIKEEENGFFGIFRIPEDNFKKLGWDTFTLYFNLGKIVVRILKKKRTESRVEYEDKQTCTAEVEKGPKEVTTSESDTRKKVMPQEVSDPKPTSTSGGKLLGIGSQETIVALGSSGEMPVRPLMSPTLESMGRSLGGTLN